MVFGFGKKKKQGQPVEQQPPPYNYQQPIQQPPPVVPQQRPIQSPPLAPPVPPLPPPPPPPEIPKKESEPEKPIELPDPKWKFLAIVLSLAVILLLGLLYSLMFRNFNDKYLNYLGLAGGIGLMFGVLMIYVVMKTVGFGLIRQIMWVAKNKKKGYLMLKIHTVSGRPKREIVKGGRWLTYQFEESGVKRDKRLYYDPLAVYNDYSADIPIIEGTPDDIFPSNRFTGTRVTTSPELVEKTIIDASRSADEFDSLKKWRRYLIIGIVGFLILAYLGFDLYSQRLAACTDSVVELAKLAGQSAVITT